MTRRMVNDKVVNDQECGVNLSARRKRWLHGNTADMESVIQTRQKPINGFSMTKRVFIYMKVELNCRVVGRSRAAMNTCWQRDFYLEQTMRSKHDFFPPLTSNLHDLLRESTSDHNAALWQSRKDNWVMWHSLVWRNFILIGRLAPWKSQRLV